MGLEHDWASRFCIAQIRSGTPRPVMAMPPYAGCTRPPGHLCRNGLFEPPRIQSFGSQHIVVEQRFIRPRRKCFAESGKAVKALAPADGFDDGGDTTTDIGDARHSKWSDVATVGPYWRAGPRYRASARSILFHKKQERNPQALKRAG